MMKNPLVVWASVAIVAMIVTASVILALADKDVSIMKDVIQTLAVPLLAGFGVFVYQGVQGLKDQTNGNWTKVLEQLERSNQQQAEHVFKMLSALSGKTVKMPDKVEPGEERADSEADRSWQ